jgi:DNA-binding NarL/FixJ family response regulator
MTLTVLIADDHYLVREGVRRALEEEPDIEVVATVGTATELEVVAAKVRPDVIVTDIRMPPSNQMDGITAALRVRSAQPGTGIVVLSQHSDPHYALALLADGTAGVAYLLKERVGDPDQLIAAVRTVALGGSAVDADVVAFMLQGSDTGCAGPLAALTNRERDVLQLMAEGRTNAGIAEALYISESSVEKHSKAIFAKLGLGEESKVHRRVAAVLTYLDRA